MLVWCSRAAALASRSNRRTCCGSEQGRVGQDLQRHAAAQRLLLGLVDHAHAAAADLAEDAVVAQPLQPGRGVDGHAAGGAAGAVGAEVLHPDQDREEVADLVGQLGVAPAVFLERGPLAAALAVEEVLGQELDGVAVAGCCRRRCVHVRARFQEKGMGRRIRGHQPSFRPGIDERISLSRFRARMYRLLAAYLGQAEHQRGLVVGQVLEVPQGQDLAVDRVHAVERLLDDQLVLGADRGRLALVILPRSCAASETELAWGNGPRWSETSRPASRSLGAQVEAMHVGQPLAGDQPEPEVERHRRGSRAYSAIRLRTSR